MLLARAVAAGALSSRCLGAVALPGHPVAGCVSHGCSSCWGPPAVGEKNTTRGTPRRPRQGRLRPRPCAWGHGPGNPHRREAVPRVPPAPVPGLQERPQPPPCPLLSTPAFGDSPASQGSCPPHHHLLRCAPSSRGHRRDGCSAAKAANKVIEIEGTRRASDPAFLLKWLQGRPCGPAPRAFPVAGPRRAAQRPGPPASLAAAASMVGSRARPPVLGGGSRPAFGD